MTERVIRIVLDDDEAQAGLDDLERGLGRTEQGAVNTTQSFRGLAAAATALVAALGIREFVQYGDELIRLQNRLGTVTDGTDNLRAVQAELVELSFRTRTSFEDNVELFTRTAAATESLGLSQQAVIELTESLSIGLRIGGATAAEASGALTQFTQGLALGRFETQELKSVLEQSVPISRALQKEFQATQGELLKLAESGELNAERVVKALRGSTLEEFREQLENLTPTAEEGFDQLTAAARLALGELNAGLGLSESLGESFNDMALSIADSTIELFEFGKTLQETLFIAIGIIDLTIEKFDTLGEEASLAIAEARDESEFLDDVLTSVAEASQSANDAIAGLPDGAQQITRLLTSPLLVAGDAIRALEEDTASVAEAEGELNESLTRQQEILDTLTAAEARFREEREARVKAREETRITADEGDGAGVDAPIDPKLMEDAQKFLDGLNEDIARARIETENFGQAADEALLRFESSQAIAGAGGQLADEINLATEALILQNRELERANELRENQADDEDFIDSLKEELVLLRLTDEEREVEIALRELSADATDAQKNEVRALTEDLIRLRDTEEEARESVRGFLEDVSGAITETVFDGFRDGFDDIETEFANFLTNLAQQIAESALTTALQNLFNVGAGQSGGAGGIIGTVAGIFAGGFQEGGTIPEGQIGMVGEDGPEFARGGPGGTDIMPMMMPQIIIQNVQDPETIVSGLDTRSGIVKQRNRVTADRRQFRRTLGLG